ncbi:hypothetical protein BZG36_00624 [Bifiguratus adelaidae]|uniref:FAD dependent oxidoreductase domain-containing protein n=1 Tax=Bifiguratus adelaidae TaxID=1938954 RepID=A0A261Y7N4_9FUNG|nr:hypothetical protein BZG36_00624 [Bifiguratus adelaidae]
MNGRRGHGVIIGPGSCITFAREGYRFFDFKLRDIIESLMNPHLWSFVFKNFRMSMNELYRDLNARTFVRSGQKLIPSLRANMVENSFAGVMGQIFGKNGEAVTDYVLERKTLNGKVLNIRNAPSPACTASLAIAEIVTDAAQEDFNWSKDMGSADFDLPREVPIEENSFLLKRAAERM